MRQIKAEVPSIPINEWNEVVSWSWKSPSHGNARYDVFASWYAPLFCFRAMRMWLAVKTVFHLLHKLHRKSGELFASEFDCMVWTYGKAGTSKVTPLKLLLILVLFPRADIENRSRTGIIVRLVLTSYLQKTSNFWMIRSLGGLSWRPTPLQGLLQGWVTPNP